MKRWINPLVLVSGLALAAGCLPPSGSASDSSSASISDGELDPGHPLVGRVSTGPTGKCSGTLIGPHTVLTAAHCLRVAGWTVRFDLDGVERPVVRATYPKEYDLSATVTHADAPDLGLLTLGADVEGIVPARLAREASAAGDLLTVVGYGLDSAGELGKKRVSLHGIDEVYPYRYLFHVGDGSGLPCSGDSGGPSFSTRAGEQDLIVGVHSGGGSCNVDASDMRVDVFAAWIDAASKL
jgi:V8-like Glu-specific endopeptidase